MKIRNDFVTNSSSSSFIITGRGDNTEINEETVYTLIRALHLQMIDDVAKVIYSIAYDPLFTVVIKSEKMRAEFEEAINALPAERLDSVQTADGIDVEYANNLKAVCSCLEYSDKIIINETIERLGLDEDIMEVGDTKFDWLVCETHKEYSEFEFQSCRPFDPLYRSTMLGGLTLDTDFDNLSDYVYSKMEKAVNIE